MLTYGRTNGRKTGSLYTKPDKCFFISYTFDGLFLSSGFFFLTFILSLAVLEKICIAHGQRQLSRDVKSDV